MVLRKDNIIFLRSVWRLSKCPKHPPLLLPLLQSLFSGELLCQHPSSTWLSAARLADQWKRFAITWLPPLTQARGRHNIWYMCVGRFFQYFPPMWKTLQECETALISQYHNSIYRAARAAKNTVFWSNSCQTGDFHTSHYSQFVVTR